MLPDVVYPYRATPYDFELRFSLRSLTNLPHDRVIIAGDRPDITNDRVTHVAVAPIADRYRSSMANILAACEASRAREIVVMHDDVFVLEPWDCRHEDRGTIREYLASGLAHGRYMAAAERTRDILRSEGIVDPLFFGLHTPTIYDRQRLINMIRCFDGQSVLLRTLYHNWYPRPSTRSRDVKLYRWTDERERSDVLSIADAVTTDPWFRRWITERFPTRSAYEVPGKCLILGHGPTVWDDVLRNALPKFDAVIASPEAAQHWPGPILAVASDDDNAEFIAQSFGFEDLIWCGREVAA